MSVREGKGMIEALRKVQESSEQIELQNTPKSFRKRKASCSKMIGKLNKALKKIF